MIPKEHLDFINIYAQKMMGQNSGQFIGFLNNAWKETMRTLEEEFAKEGEKVKLHELMVHHPDTSYDEFVTHVNNKMTRSLNSRSASNHKAKKLVSSEQSELEPAYAALKPPSSHEKRFTSFSRYRLSHVS